MKIHVECYAGYRGEQEPRAIDFKRLMVNPMSMTRSRITGIYVWRS
jgi:hypothetical protein